MTPPDRRPPDGPHDAPDPAADPALLEAQRVARLKRRWLVAVVVGVPLMQFARLLAFDSQGHLRTWDAVVQAAKGLFGA